MKSNQYKALAFALLLAASLTGCQSKKIEVNTTATTRYSMTASELSEKNLSEDNLKVCTDKSKSNCSKVTKINQFELLNLKDELAKRQITSYKTTFSPLVGEIKLAPAQDGILVVELKNTKDHSIYITTYNYYEDWYGAGRDSVYTTSDGFDLKELKPGSSIPIAMSETENRTIKVFQLNNDSNSQIK
jgi:hypothetical protein